MMHNRYSNTKKHTFAYGSIRHCLFVCHFDKFSLYTATTRMTDPTNKVISQCICYIYPFVESMFALNENETKVKVTIRFQCSEMKAL